jgi:hypothetical protein
MGFFDKLRNAIAGPPHVNAGGDSEVEATLHEEFGAPNKYEAEVNRTDDLSGGAVMPGLAAPEAADLARDEFESEEAPRDPTP